MTYFERTGHRGLDRTRQHLSSTHLRYTNFAIADFRSARNSNLRLNSYCNLSASGRGRVQASEQAAERVPSGVMRDNFVARRSSVDGDAIKS